MLESQIYLCYSVQPCVKEGGKCKVYRWCYHRDLLYDGDGLMHRRMTTMQFFWFSGERPQREWAHLRWSKNSSLRLSHPILLLRTMQSHQQRQQTKSSCQHMLSSREITPAGLGGESLWHAHTVTASADTSWDIGLVCIEYKKGKKTFFCFFTLSNVQSVLALCRWSRRCCPVRISHSHVLPFSVSLRGRNLFLGEHKTWNHCSCCRLAEVFVCNVGGLKQQWEVRHSPLLLQRVLQHFDPPHKVFLQVFLALPLPLQEGDLGLKTQK